ncbi:BDNF/NT-3 growth factors receptor-like [Thrips palmi]|uniref:BDNF/NT-3 growth factors receptor-like n=1 Tax=Thrips palmi TaxID=161013 RepID=A0A6P8ZK84_THRPL|nr:BDNF/NT-3 growth factors receptor-like [Thrips palmi]
MPRKGRASRTSRGVQSFKESSLDDDSWREGNCREMPCDFELGCENHVGQMHHRCICPHDAKPARQNKECSRRTVPLDHRAPPINVLPVGATPGTKATTSRSGASPPSTVPPHLLADRVHDADLGGHGLGHGLGHGGGPVTAVRGSSANQLLTFAGFTMFGVAVVLAIIVVVCVRSRYTRSRKNQTPRSLSKGPLGSELFLPNPQYSVGLTSLGDAALAAHGQQPVVPLIARHALTLHENIGEGCFGKVFRGELKSADCPVTVAVKVLKESATREAEEDFMREVEVMSAFQHPHILRLIGVLPREPQSAPCMVFEFMPFGDLTEVLRCSSKSPWMPPRPGLPPLSQEALLGVALQIALGMRYLANQRFVHRDLACRNCLVGHNLTVKIADFGMSRDVYTCDYYKMGGTRALPVRWMSPEALLYGRFTLESDVWSFGVVLWEVFTRGKLPYYGHANDEALELVLRGVLLQLPDDPDCPPAVLDLMRCCWRTEPRDRLRFPEVCSRLEEALEASLREMRLESDALDAELPRPPGFPAVYPDLGMDLGMDLALPALPDDLLLLPSSAAACPRDRRDAGRPDGCEELQLDPENYLLPRVPDPERVEYMEPIAD